MASLVSRTGAVTTGELVVAEVDDVGPAASGATNSKDPSLVVAGPAAEEPRRVM